ncbi:serine/threonine-protein kinase, active site protein [Artemisia annua]|uniref:non-specific serine/threonine protein kinase n=1 Tax=Artemisia annua TaxID=35608 RepID=A0A2U1NL95_ARTAN|nr:serine/threonine-protein kinase, active site protein [Artemisia annua]
MFNIGAQLQVPNQQPQPSDIHLKMPPPISSSASYEPHKSGDSSGPYQSLLPPPHPGFAMGFSHNTFTYDELATATRGFDRSLLIGQGGFGYVYKGVLPNGKEVAVKSLKAGSGQGEREFQAEVEIISRVHHRHLVSLVGYCIAGEKRMLVYEFIPNRTLEYHLQRKGRVFLDCSTRLKIALGSAKGFAYLHEDCIPRIIHRDIKAANILIDNQFEAKVADFGLAKLSADENTHVSTRIMGTFGYLAPEYASTGKLTEKSDVFSYGVVLLELITGRRAVEIDSDDDDSLIDWATPVLIQASEGGSFDEMVDPRLGGNYNRNEMHRMVACAAICLRHAAKRRPKMSQVVRILEGDVSLEDLNKANMKSNATLGSSETSPDYALHSNNGDNRRNKPGSMSSQEFSSGEYGL